MQHVETAKAIKRLEKQKEKHVFVVLPPALQPTRLSLCVCVCAYCRAYGNHSRPACTPPTPLVIIEREGEREERGLQRPLCINMRVTHWTIVVVLTVTAVECGTSNMCRRKRERERERAYRSNSKCSLRVEWCSSDASGERFLLSNLAEI